MALVRPSEEQWELLTTLIDLAAGREVVPIACADRAVQEALRARLRHHCEQTGRSFLSPADGEDGLDWLTSMLGPASSGAAGELEPKVPPVLFFPLPPDTGRETFILHRLNENRDNLRRDLWAVLCLVGGSEFLRRLPNEAPDLWSARHRSFEFASLALPPGVAAAAPEPALARKPAAEPPRYDVFLSGSERDVALLLALRERLQEDGLCCALDEQVSPEEDVPLAERALQSRFVVIGVSPDYVTSVWPSHESTFTADPESFRGRAVLLKLREAVIPAPLRVFGMLDWSTEEHREKSYPKLHQILEGKGRELPERAPEPEDLSSEGHETPEIRDNQIKKKRSAWRSRLADLSVPLMGTILTILMILYVGCQERYYAADALFPGFGLGTVTAEASSGKVELTRHGCVKPCLGAGDDLIGRSLEVKGWQGGSARIVLRKVIGPVNILLPYSHPPAFNIALRLHVEPAPNAVEVTLLDWEGRRARYKCSYSDVGLFEYHDLVVRSSLPVLRKVEFDPSNIKEITIGIASDIMDKETMNRFSASNDDLLLSVDGMSVRGIQTENVCLPIPAP